MRRLLRSFRRLLDDEAGTSMTEFAVTLPVFLGFFMLIMGTGNIVQGVLHAQTQPASDFWTDVYEEEDDVMRMQPQVAAANDYHMATNSLVGSGKTLGILGGGHWGESFAQAQGSMFAVTQQSIPGNLEDDPASNLTFRSSDIVGDESGMVTGITSDDPLNWPNQPERNDTYTNWIGDGLGWVAYGLQISQMQLALGAGTRYGSAVGGSETTIDPGYGLPEFTSGTNYTARISPNQDPPDFPGLGANVQDMLGGTDNNTWTFARIHGEKHPQYAEMFNIAEGYNTSGGSGWGGFTFGGSHDRMEPNGSVDIPDVYDETGGGTPWSPF